MQETSTQTQRFTKKEKSWILYDVANSAYVMLATALLSLYLAYLASADNLSDLVSILPPFFKKMQLSPEDNLSTIWSFTNVIVTIIAVFLCPILGTFADFSKKKSIFMTFALIGIISCGVLSLFSILSKFAIASIYYTFSCVVLHAVLCPFSKNPFH